MIPTDSKITDPTPGRGVRWWPALIIVLGGLARLVFIWRDADLPRQAQVMSTGVVTLVVAGLLLLWVMGFSRMRWRSRWSVLGCFVGAVGLALLVFRFVGVTGDLVPIFEGRWKRSAASPVGAAQAQVAAVAADTVVTAATTPGPALPGFSQFLGDHRDGTVGGVRLLPDWTNHPPRLLWRQPLGSGWGGFAIAGNLALTQEQDGPDEVVACFELQTGRRVWAHRDAARYDNPIGGIGPRATPTVVSNRVYALGATGFLNCLNLADGAVLWSTNVVNGRPVSDLGWGLSSSPLVISNRVIVAPLGRQPSASLMAFRADTGEGVWSGGTAEPHYSSARLETLRGVAQILTFTGAGVAGHDPGTGAKLWEHPWRGGHPHVADPRVVDPERGEVLVTSGYGTGAHLIEVAPGADGKWSVTEVVWRSMRLKSKFANVILRGPVAYGLDDGRLVCLDLKEGTRRWDGERYGHGQLLLVGEFLLVTAENGNVVLVDAAPDVFRERTRFSAVTGKTWNPAAMAGDVLIVRNDREAAAFRLPLQP